VSGWGCSLLVWQLGKEVQAWQKIAACAGLDNTHDLRQAHCLPPV